MDKIIFNELVKKGLIAQVGVDYTKYESAYDLISKGIITRPGSKRIIDELLAKLNLQDDTNIDDPAGTNDNPNNDSSNDSDNTVKDDDNDTKTDDDDVTVDNTDENTSSEDATEPQEKSVKKTTKKSTKTA